jgi:Uma2 family endonuclease
MTSLNSSTTTGPEYAWEVATLYPAQGDWSEEAYLALTDSTNRRIEFVDGWLEFLPMPTEVHQILVRFLFRALDRFVDARKIGEVHFSGLRVRVRPRKIRQPDIIFLHKDRFHHRHNCVWDGADLVMEVVSDDAKDRVRDYEEKLADYAAGGIVEYWVVDPKRQAVVVHRLSGKQYATHGEFTAGDKAVSALLDGFDVDVTTLFAAAADVPE